MKTPKVEAVTIGKPPWRFWRFTCKEHVTTTHGKSFSEMVAHLRWGHGIKARTANNLVETARDKAGRRTP